METMGLSERTKCSVTKTKHFINHRRNGLELRKRRFEVDKYQRGQKIYGWDSSDTEVLGHKMSS